MSAPGEHGGDRAGLEQTGNPPTKRDRARNTRSTSKRWDFAVDRVLNSGLMCGYMESFWAYVDGQITWEKFTEEMSP